MIEPRSRRMERAAAVALSVLFIGLIGWVDLVSGPELALSVFYLVPVAFAAWRGGVISALVTAGAAAVAWLLADLGWRQTEAAIAIAWWNALTRFVMFATQGVFIAMLRRDREALRRLAVSEAALARTDAGTKLPNARAFLELVDAELHRARVTGDPVCVVYVDLDNFKEINDRFGHAAGDEVLMKVADALMHSIRGHDVAARLGGDEFGVLLRGVDPEVARRVGERIAGRIRDIGYADTNFGATVGVAHCRAIPEHAADLLRAADGAMYAGKAAAKGSVVVQSL